MNGNMFAKALQILGKYAEKHEIPIEKVGGIVIDYEADRTSDQLTREEKSTFRPLIDDELAALFAADPNAEIDPNEVATRLDMPVKQGSRSLIRHRAKVLRLTHQPKDIAAD